MTHERDQAFDVGAVAKAREGSGDGVVLGSEPLAGGGRELDADQLGGAGA